MDQATSMGIALKSAEKTIYKEGDTIKITTNGFSFFLYSENNTVSNGNQVLEVEVKSVKTAKTILE